MRLRPSRVPCPSTGIGRRVLLLSVTCALLLLAGCGASTVGGASVPSPGGTPASHRLGLASWTCPAARATIPTPSAPSPTVPPGAHLSYFRLGLGPVPLQLVYHLGANLRFLWCALPDPYQVTTQPVPETLTAGFIGPFATRAAATADDLLPPTPPGRTSGPPHDFLPPGPIVASTVPIHTTTWSGADASAPLTLPATLAPGYYIFFAQADISVQACLAVTVGRHGCGSGGGERHIVQITRA